MESINDKFDLLLNEYEEKRKDLDRMYNLSGKYKTGISVDIPENISEEDKIELKDIINRYNVQVRRQEDEINNIFEKYRSDNIFEDEEEVYEASLSGGRTRPKNKHTKARINTIIRYTLEALIIAATIKFIAEPVVENVIPKIAHEVHKNNMREDFQELFESQVIEPNVIDVDGIAKLYYGNALNYENIAKAFMNFRPEHDIEVKVYLLVSALGKEEANKVLEHTNIYSVENLLKSCGYYNIYQDSETGFNAFMKQNEEVLEFYLEQREDGVKLR